MYVPLEHAQLATSVQVMVVPMFAGLTVFVPAVVIVLPPLVLRIVMQHCLAYPRYLMHRNGQFPPVGLRATRYISSYALF